jgi:hypothetical protein
MIMLRAAVLFLIPFTDIPFNRQQKAKKSQKRQQILFRNVAELYATNDP